MLTCINSFNLHTSTLKWWCYYYYHFTNEETEAHTGRLLMIQHLTQLPGWHEPGPRSWRGKRCRCLRNLLARRWAWGSGEGTAVGPGWAPFYGFSSDSTVGSRILSTASVYLDHFCLFSLEQIHQSAAQGRNWRGGSWKGWIDHTTPSPTF